MSGFTYSAFADEYSPVFDEQLAELKTLGITHIEPRGIDGVSVAKLTRPQAELAGEKLRASGLSVSAIGAPAGKARLSDFDEHFKEYQNTLEVGRILGADKIRGFSFYVDDKKTDRASVLRCLYKMITEAEKYGMLYCHENEKGIYGDDLEGCEDIQNEFGSSVGCVFDPANFIQCGVDPKAAFDALYRRITYMHIKDASADGTIFAAGEGTGIVPYMLNRLKDDGRYVTLTLEPHLRVFSGLNALEGEERSKLQNVFKTNKEAFEYAYKALRKITDLL